MDTDFVKWGNIVEGVFWVAVSLLFFVPAVRRGERHRAFCVLGGCVFLLWGLSDFYEAHTGAWWRPWWLMVWNGLCFVGCVAICVWYARINAPLREHLKSFKPLRLPFLGRRRRP